jgi:predicted hydrocarbon binding protein
MSGRSCEPVSCCRSEASLGGIASKDFSMLDKLAVTLICLDSGFGSPLRKIGERIGQRIATERAKKRLSLADALCAMIPACGLHGVIESRLERSSAEETVLQITGCAAVLGGQIPNLGRTVCTFDAGVFEGFLRGVTGDEALTVEEMACLGRGNACCEFAIHHRPVIAGPRKGVAYGDC